MEALAFGVRHRFASIPTKALAIRQGMPFLTPLEAEA